ncbi:unnamed protein product [Polarella glacialis]|uniref:Uncharacterized protein n=1 Tax=Polarella glacialis TaxID=89957 RepID=A0A813I4R6_POLGL|nr:unnamed protein product [Polarella glacialis]CAE8646903.1 unnamed protein product [Polarella glacialis]
MLASKASGATGAVMTRLAASSLRPVERRAAVAVAAAARAVRCCWLRAEQDLLAPATKRAVLRLGLRMASGAGAGDALWRPAATTAGTAAGAAVMILATASRSKNVTDWTAGSASLSATTGFVIGAGLWSDTRAAQRTDFFGAAVRLPSEDAAAQSSATEAAAFSKSPVCEAGVLTAAVAAAAPDATAVAERSGTVVNSAGRAAARKASPALATRRNAATPRAASEA